MESKIKSILLEAGFGKVGFLNKAQAVFEDWYQPWIKKNYHADMLWFEQNGHLRINPCSIVDNAKSIITLATPYYTKRPDFIGGKNPISCYAWGEDYHKVIRKMLKSSIKALSQEFKDFNGRGFVDTAPLPEKVLAQQSGLGWIGKNGILINPDYGSYLFLAEIVCNLDLKSTKPIKDNCGKCRLCLDNCPTKAIKSNKMIDAGHCLSYLTIEKKGEFSKKEEKMIDYQLFGCDLCQEVCPFNQKLTPLSNSPFNCLSKWGNLKIDELVDITDDQFEQLKQKSALKRLKPDNLKRNARAIIKQL